METDGAGGAEDANPAEEARDRNDSREDAMPAPPAEEPKRVDKRARGRTIALSVLGVALVGGGVGYEVLRHPRHVDARSAIPASSFLAITLDMRTLRAASWFGRLTGDDAGKFVGLPNLKGMCGYDATAFVDEIDVAVPEGGDHGDFGVVMEAKDKPLDDKALVGCAQKLAGAHAPAAGGSADTPAPKPDLHDRHGFTVLQQDGVARFAMRPAGPYLAGRGSWLETMIDSAAGVVPSIASNADHTALRGAVTKALPPGTVAAIVATTLLPPGVRQEVRTEMLGETDPTSAAAMDGVLGVSGAAIAMGTRAADGQVDVAIELRCETPQACSEVQALIERKRGGIARDFRVRLLGLGTAVDSLAVTGDGSAVHASLHFDPDALARAISRFTGGGHGGGGGPGAGAAGMPGMPGHGQAPPPPPFSGASVPPMPSPSALPVIPAPRTAPH